MFRKLFDALIVALGGHTASDYNQVVDDLNHAANIGADLVHNAYQSLLDWDKKDYWHMKQRVHMKVAAMQKKIAAMQERLDQLQQKTMTPSNERAIVDLQAEIATTMRDFELRTRGLYLFGVTTRPKRATVSVVLQAPQMPALRAPARKHSLAA